MSTIPSAMSAAGQSGLDFNIAITANNEKVIADIELNQESSQAANKMNLAGSQAQEASILSQASQQTSQAIGQFASAIGGGVAGYGLMTMESSFANKAQKIASGPEEMKVITTDVPPSSTSNRGTIPSEGPERTTEATVDGYNSTNTKYEDTSNVPTKERVKSPKELEYNRKEGQYRMAHQYFPSAIQSIAQSGGNMAAANEKKNEAEAQAMSTAASGLTGLLSRNAEAATAAQNSAETNKDSLIKTLESMILANRVA
jgi:hypothetical protein